MSGGNFLQDNRPATFEERGVAVPLTSAAAAGVRFRAADPWGPVFILPETGGGHGWTAVSPDVMAEVCDLTLHDRMLLKALAAMGDASPSPARVRAAARRVAATGVGGRVARRAARMAMEREREDTLVTHFLLALELVGELGIDVAEWEHLDPDDPELTHWLDDTAARAAAAMGVEATAMARALRSLAEMIQPLGMPRGPGGARLPTALEGLEAFVDSMWVHAEREPGEEGVVAGRVAAIAGICAELGARTLAAARDRLGSSRALVAEWFARPEVVTRGLTRLDWLLDGWDGVCALWNEAEANGRDARRSIMPTLQRMTPMPPREVLIEAGAKVPEGAETWYQGRWMNAGDDDRGEGARLDRVCRHEILRAHTA